MSRPARLRRVDPIITLAPSPSRRAPPPPSSRRAANAARRAALCSFVSRSSARALPAAAAPRRDGLRVRKWNRKFRPSGSADSCGEAQAPARWARRRAACDTPCWRSPGSPPARPRARHLDAARPRHPPRRIRRRVGRDSPLGRARVAYHPEPPPPPRGPARPAPVLVLSCVDSADALSSDVIGRPASRSSHLWRRSRRRPGGAQCVHLRGRFGRWRRAGGSGSALLVRSARHVAAARVLVRALVGTRGTWWRARVRLMAARGADDAAFDVLGPPTPHSPLRRTRPRQLAPARRRQNAVDPRAGAHGSCANRPKRAMAWLPKPAFADVERVLAERWHAQRVGVHLAAGRRGRARATRTRRESRRRRPGSAPPTSDSVAFPRRSRRRPTRRRAREAARPHARVVVTFERRAGHDATTSKQRLPKGCACTRRDGRRVARRLPLRQRFRKISRRGRPHRALLPRDGRALRPCSDARTSADSVPTPTRGGVPRSSSSRRRPHARRVGRKNKRADAVVERHQTWIKTQALAEESPEAKAKAEAFLFL